MSLRTIILASPIEPSGASWLINCLIELGIRVEHRPAVERLWRRPQTAGGASPLWLADGARWRLHPRAAVLAKWMPSLLGTASFAFREDVTVDYVQCLPRPVHADHDVALFVRDPRDAIYSHYRRRASRLSFAAHCAAPNADTLLPAAAHWALNVRAWRELAKSRVYRFEDYKRDAEGLLDRILRALDLRYSAAAVERAAALSTSARAMAAEAAYRAANPDDTEVANRAGRVGDAGGRAEIAGSVALIERCAGSVMRDLGYRIEGSEIATEELPVAQVHFMNLFREVLLPAELRTACSEDPITHSSLTAALGRIHGLTEGGLVGAGRPSAEVRSLIASCEEFIAAYADRATSRLHALQSAFAEGSVHHLKSLRTLHRQRRNRSGGPSCEVLDV